MKKQKHMPLLLISVLSSMLFVSLVSAVSAQGIYQEYNTGEFSQPSVAVLMEGLSHQVYPWSRESQSFNPGRIQLAEGGSSLPESQPVSDPSDTPSGTSPDSVPPGNGPAVPSGASSAPSEPAAPSGGPGTEGPEPGTPIHPTADNPGAAPSDDQNPAPEPEQYEFTEVGQDYFDDALFIGDSRAVGVQLYSGWDNLTYYAESGMTVYNMFNRKITDKDGSETTIEEALKVHSFGKIYLEIGINEMGTGNVDSFMEAYENAVLHLRELQPEADLFLCAIMYVRQSKSDSDPIFNNPNIRERNERIAALADGKTIFYLDINEVTSDDTGNLNPDYTWDEIHLLGKYNVLWTDYLSSHGIVK